MGFRKAQYDVEEKGLDPTKPHNDIGDDGRLKNDVVDPKPPAAESPPKEKPKTKAKPKAKPKQEGSTREPSKGVAANGHKKKKAATPKKEKVSDETTPEDELSQVTQELADSKPEKTEPKKRTTKSRTRKKTNTSSSKTTKKGKGRGKKET